MNQEQVKRLEKIFIDNQNNGIAIAITGCWGVGKTFAWNRFLKTLAKEEEDKVKHLPAFQRKNDQKIFSKKYAYVSLFGIENLSDLKAAISTNMSSNYFNPESSKNFEIPAFVKKGLTALREVKLTSSEYGISSSARIFESMLYAQVKDAIICFDDFERMSKKLDIKDVMGLANQLKLERNCQVILILDETKNEDENKKKYAEYKEKLIDETIKITSVEPLIRENTKEIDEPLVDLMVKFADELEIHNFRFFKKVIKFYKYLISQFSENLADSTKEIILIRVLQGYFIEEFGISREFSWNDVRLVFEDKQKDWSENKVKTYETLKSLNYYFVSQDQWLIEFKKWFEQTTHPNFEELYKLAHLESISEENNKVGDQLNQLMKEWRNLEVDDNYSEQLYEVAVLNIGIGHLESFAFYCELLREFEAPDLADQLQSKVEQWLSQEYIKKGLKFVDQQFHFGFKQDNHFHVYLENLKNIEPYQGLPALIDIIYRYIEHGGYNSKTDSLVMEKATKEDWHKLIFSDIPADERFKKIDKFFVLNKILKQQIATDLHPQIRKLIFEILEQEAAQSKFGRRKSLEYVIKQLKE